MNVFCNGGNNLNNKGASQRIWIVGPPGSGKTTLAHQLKQELALPHYELDALFWQANWKKQISRCLSITSMKLLNKRNGSLMVNIHLFITYWLNMLIRSFGLM
ncbi:AAA family ATPase [Bacillus safensis]|uniref:AAA family ATPase n=1 Tax=Bacillus safensis TaxID=561879 RepID=UPI0012DB0B02